MSQRLRRPNTARVGRKVMTRLVTREPCTWDTHHVIRCEGQHLEQEAEAGVGSHQHSQASHYQQL